MKFASHLVACLLLLISLVFTGCKNRNYPPPPPLETEEGARFGEGSEFSGSQYPDGEYGSEAGRDSRFGFSGGDNRNNPREVREMQPSERENLATNTQQRPPQVETPQPKPEEPKKQGPPSVSEMPFAKPVSGDPLSVTLPGQHASLGAISVEKYDSSGKPTGQPLPRGTPVEIPDPSNPGQKIYFKVP